MIALTALLIIGLLIIIVGIMLLVAPKVLSNINHSLNKTLGNDQFVYTYRLRAAVLLIIFGLFFMGLYIYYLPQF